jgi:hypothetical protein
LAEPDRMPQPSGHNEVDCFDLGLEPTIKRVKFSQRIHGYQLRSA